MRVENGTVVLEHKDCNCASDSRLEPGTVIDKFAAKLCPKCKGTGKRGSGRCRNCNERNGYWSNQFPRTPGYVADYESYTVKTCPHCNGNWQNFDSENMTDSLSAEDVAKIPIRVVRMPNRPITFNESHIGAGTVYSIVDYGRSRDWTDEEFINTVRESIQEGWGSRQACKYANKEQVMCKEIVIITSNQGFSAWPSWEA